MATTLFLHPKYRPPPTPEKGIFDPELSLTIQDKEERRLREFQESIRKSSLSPRSSQGSQNVGKRGLPDPKMRVFITYQDETMPIDVAEGKKVSYVKQLVKNAFGIRPSQPSRGVETADTVLCLNYAGANLDDEWILSEIGVHPGSSLHAFLRDEEQPTLHVKCVHNNDALAIYQKFKPREMLVSEVRSIASKKSGLPVGIFRLVTSEDRKEMYDVNTLDKYDVTIGDTVNLETWDGWADFINLASRGFTTHALGKLSNDELIARYQMKVALYMAAYFGHVDLAVALLRQGVRSDEPIGEHPYRQWCSSVTRHIDSMKCPIHVASEAGQFGIVRTFVHNNICCVMAKDGNGLRPLNLALRNKQKSCASFLLTKQWSRINFDSTSIPLSLFAKMKTWSVKAKEKALMLHGQEKSTLKKKTNTDGPLVGQGIYLDGFSECIMTSKPRVANIKDSFKIANSENAYKEFLREDPEFYFRNIMTNRNKVARPLARFSRGMSKSLKTPDADSSHDEFKLPSITEKQARSRRSSVVSQYAGEHKDERLPSISNKRNDRIREDAESPTSVFGPPPTEDEPQHSKRKADNKKKQPEPEFLLLQAKTAEATIPLPIHSAETIPRPHFQKGALDYDLAASTMAQYEIYRGMKAKDYAVKCLSIASTFKERPWLQQVRMALTLTNKSVKKKVKRRRVARSEEPMDALSEEQDEEEEEEGEEVQPVIKSIVEEEEEYE